MMRFTKRKKVGCNRSERGNPLVQCVPPCIRIASSATAAFLGFVLLSMIQPIEAPKPHALLAPMIRIPTPSR